MITQVQWRGSLLNTANKIKVPLIVATLVATSIGNVQALEMGFEGVLSYELRQNTDDINPDDEIGNADSEFANGLLAVFGEQRGVKLNAGFSAEIETERDLSDDGNAAVNTETRFIGAADYAVTPRTLRWYFGDLLTGVRNDDTVRLADDLDQDSRNIFITGPSYQSVVQGFSTTEARLFFVHQMEDDEEIEALYNFRASYQRDTTVGSFYGVEFNDIFTSVPEDINQDLGFVGEEDGDFNRASITAFTNRASQFSELYGEIGVTQYDTDDESLNGLTAEVRSTRFLGPRTTFTASLSHSLNDQALNTVEALIQGGGDDAGLQPEVDGIFEESRLDIAYSFDRPTSEFEFGLGIAQLNYRLLTGSAGDNIEIDGEDRNLGTVIASYAKTHSARLTGVYTAEYEREEFINRTDESDAFLLTANFNYRLTRSFVLEFSLEFDAAEGLNTRGNADNPVQIEIDETESRAILGVRWAPPTRASRELTVQLNSLLD